jgi:hypothetical protein
MNKIDMGIALAHLWLAAEHEHKKIVIEKLDESPEPVEGFNYLLTVKL